MLLRASVQPCTATTAREQHTCQPCAQAAGVHGIRTATRPEELLPGLLLETVAAHHLLPCRRVHVTLAAVPVTVCAGSLRRRRRLGPAWVPARCCQARGHRRTIFFSRGVHNRRSRPVRDPARFVANLRARQPRRLAVDPTRLVCLPPRLCSIEGTARNSETLARYRTALGIIHAVPSPQVAGPACSTRTVTDRAGSPGQRRAARCRAASVLSAVLNSPAPRAFGGRPRGAAAVGARAGGGSTAPRPPGAPRRLEPPARRSPAT